MTVTDKGDRCESACALVFLSAYNSFAGYPAPRRFTHLDARIGVHQPAVEFDPSDPRVKSGTPDDLFRLANLAVFDDQRSMLSGNRSDLIALCANRFAARHDTQSDTVVRNFMLRRKHF